MRFFPLLMVLCTSFGSYGQQKAVISGRILNERTLQPIQGVFVQLEGSTKGFVTNALGQFELNTTLTGKRILMVQAKEYLVKRIPVFIEREGFLSLGDIVLSQDIAKDKEENLITLTDGELVAEEVFSVSSGLLQSTKDLFLRRAAFDFGQVFFRVRGYDSRNGEVLLNGIPMNKPENGRPQWNNWGGLNDVTRNQEFTNGLHPNRNTFGGILGNTNIDLRPSNLRKGLRLSSSASNRTYRGRLMATYNSGTGDNGLAYSFSTSRRWSEAGFIEGTLYDAYSLFGAIEYEIDSKNTLMLAGVLAKNRRGRSSAITQEVFNLTSNRYNPYWGDQNGNLRNSRQNRIFEPIFLLSYFLDTDKMDVNLGVAYQFGSQARSRIGFYNAPNPDPTYYRYLPSYYLNGSLGADFINANLAREGFLSNPQLQWESLYTSNENPLNGGKAAYVLYDDASELRSISVSGTSEYIINDTVTLGVGGSLQTNTTQNFAKIDDLLGAQFHEDIDVFSETKNDVNGNINKVAGDLFNYNYELSATHLTSFVQSKFSTKKITGFLAASLGNSNFRRNGLFQNERFLENSIGESPEMVFFTTSGKIGVTYFFSGRHWISGNAASLQRPPTLQNLFVNPRENNDIVPNIKAEDITSVDLSYFARLPYLTGRISAYYTRFMNTTDINFFFVDSGLGSDFVQEVITGLDRLHKGIELGVEYEVSSSVKLSVAGNLGHYLFASDPIVQINFDTAGLEEELIDPEGTIELGISKLKNLKLPQGPQTAFSLGVDYRDPKYWWLGATTNYLGNNYVNISTITRTPSFVLNPETGLPFPDATKENVAQLLEQERLEDVYLLNLVGGKSWIYKEKYISAFLSVNNLFGAVFRTGGFEQSRNGNYGQLRQDNLSGSPSFAPRYWYGFGRTYFLNLAISF